MRWILGVVIFAWLVAGILAYAIKKHAYKFHHERFLSKGYTRKEEWCCWCYAFWGLLGLVSILDHEIGSYRSLGLCFRMPRELVTSLENKRR